MILVLSGEGPTDIGTRQPKGPGWEFVPGPMAWIIDRLLDKRDRLDYSILELHANGGDCVRFLNEGELSALRPTRPIYLPRSEDTPGSQYFRVGAILLGRHAKAISIERRSPVIAVFFRDADGTRSTPRAEWQSKFNSMQRGFKDVDLLSGVPMVPRPKSEAWMLCGLLKRGNAGRNCNALERKPGNDASPKSLKALLAKHLGFEPSSEQQSQLIRSGQIDPEMIDLPSFSAFRNELDRAYANAVQPLN
jgi:hypothetical protein